jgi:hypothetical protein
MRPRRPAPRCRSVTSPANRWPARPSGGSRRSPASSGTASTRSSSGRSIPLEAIVALFTDDAVVLDERRTWSGREAIRAWQHGPASRYLYTTHLAGVSRTGDGSFRATGRIEGNFPGGTAVLNWDFTLAGDRITRLEIGPEA